MTEYDEVLDAAMALLHSDYIFPDKAVEAEQAVRAALASGAFDGLGGEAFCEAVTAVLFEVCADKHLRLLWNDEPAEEDEDTEGMFEALSRSVNHGFQRAEWLDGNIGYVDLRLVTEPKFSAPLMAGVMRLLGETDAMILDLRKNRGGSTHTVAIWCTYFLRDEVHLNDVYTRKTDKTQQYWTVAHVEGPKYLDKPLYVLTSGMTFSGAEELTYNLKVNGRATVVGETTRGGAHPTEWHQVHPHMSLTVPNARSINPVTGTNWEGVGIEPHVAVPADEAFDVAYAAALKALGK